MNKHSNSEALFTASGCLSLQAMENYRKGLLPDKDRQQVEKHLESCPLCADALEGISANAYSEDVEMNIGHYSAAETPESSNYGHNIKSPDIAYHTENIHARLRRKHAYEPVIRKRAARKTTFRNFYIPAAASIIILAGIISYFQFFFPEKQELAVVENENMPQLSGKKEIEPKGAPISDTSLQEATTIGGVMNYNTEPADEAEGPQKLQEIEDVEVAEENIDTKLAVPLEESRIEEVVREDAEELEVLAEQVPVMEEKAAYATDELAGAETKGEKMRSAKNKRKTSDREKDAQPVLLVAEQMPEFPGGEDSLDLFIKNNLVFPSITDEQMTENSVLLSFIVNENGTLSDIKVLRGEGKAFHQEAVRVVELMPPWNPGMQDGHKVRVLQRIEVLFEKK